MVMARQQPPWPPHSFGNFEPYFLQTASLSPACEHIRQSMVMALQHWPPWWALHSSGNLLAYFLQTACLEPIEHVRQSMVIAKQQAGLVGLGLNTSMPFIASLTTFLMSLDTLSISGFRRLHMGLRLLCLQNSAIF